MSKHTKGPWTFSTAPNLPATVHVGILSDGRTRQNWSVSLDRATATETEANARLIACAPNLLESLHHMTAILVCRLGVGLDQTEVAQLQRALDLISQLENSK